MEILKNYNNYKQYDPQYAQWKKQKDIDYAKKMEYLKKNPLSEDEKKEAAQRGKVLLNAINVMDEYSQIRAQDAETITDQITGSIISYAAGLGMLGGAVVMRMLQPKKIPEKFAEKMPEKPSAMFNKKLIIPYAIGIIVSVAASIPLISWAAQVQIGASRHGRHEAMKKDLNNPQKFAILDSKQEEKAQKIAKDIPVDKEMKKQLQSQDINLNPLNFISTIKELFGKNKEYELSQKEFDEKLKSDKAKFDLPLSNKEILAAKKDKQLLLNLVEKIDIASQDYSENIEFATNTFMAFALGGGALTGWLASKIVKNIPLKNPQIKKYVPVGVGFLTTLGLSAYAASIQKQASRIGRYKTKKDLEQNVNNFAYVDDEKIKSQPEVPVEKVKKPNIFKFALQVIKDNKDYKKYLKTQAVEEKKYQKALEQIELSEEQSKQAKTLQQNTFRTFSKVDDNSQKYSESIEALGQIVQSPIASVGNLLGIGIGSLVAIKKAEKMKRSNQKIVGAGLKLSIPIFAGMVLGMLPAIGFDFYITKEQKKASRIADMMAIKELSDYKNFVNYDNIKSHA